MTIKVGDKIPHATLRQVTPDGAVPVTTEDFFAGRKVVLFGLPGAFTPTCHKNHLPGFIEHEQAFKDKGVAEIAMTSVNDHYVLDAWAKATGRDRQGDVPGRRQRRIRQGARPGIRRRHGRPRPALEALFDAGRRRRGQAIVRRGQCRARPTSPGRRI